MKINNYRTCLLQILVMLYLVIIKRLLLSYFKQKNNLNFAMLNLEPSDYKMTCC